MNTALVLNEMRRVLRDEVALIHKHGVLFLKHFQMSGFQAVGSLSDVSFNARSIRFSYPAKGANDGDGIHKIYSSLLIEDYLVWKLEYLADIED